tara:strand:- start:374 stop:517 length:144 start_codon:yes stop_codon:yes gene_type:complete
MIFHVRIGHDILQIFGGNLNKFGWRASLCFDDLNNVSQFEMKRKPAA